MSMTGKGSCPTNLSIFTSKALFHYFIKKNRNFMGFKFVLMCKSQKGLFTSGLPYREKTYIGI